MPGAKVGCLLRNEVVPGSVGVVDDHRGKHHKKTFLFFQGLSHYLRNLPGNFIAQVGLLYNPN